MRIMAAEMGWKLWVGWILGITNLQNLVYVVGSGRKQGKFIIIPRLWSQMVSKTLIN